MNVNHNSRIYILQLCFGIFTIFPGTAQAQQQKIELLTSALKEDKAPTELVREPSMVDGALTYQ